MHKCKYIKYLYGVSPTENVYYITKSGTKKIESPFEMLQTAIVVVLGRI